MGANHYTENSLTGHDIPAVSGVYLLTDIVTNKTYVGASKNIRTRAIQHFSRMATNSKYAPYTFFSYTYAIHGSSGFTFDVLEVCEESRLLDRELHWFHALKPTENTMKCTPKGAAFSEDERERRSERVRKLWADPVYRARATAARKGNAYAIGYKCTPAQTENRKKAGRISNMKRNYGEYWRDEYARRYPEHTGDLDGK